MTEPYDGCQDPVGATCQLLTGFRSMMSTMTAGIAAFDTALGTCGVRWTEQGIAGVRLPSPRTADLPRLDVVSGVPAPVREAIAAITRLLAGDSVDLGFVVLDDQEIDPFRREVYAATRAIPPGSTATYGEIARAIGRPDGARDVGAALARNPTPIIVPCHRVLGANGKLDGVLRAGWPGDEAPDARARGRARVRPAGALRLMRAQPGASAARSF